MDHPKCKNPSHKKKKKNQHIRDNLILSHIVNHRHIVALFIIAKLWKQPSLGTDRLCLIHTMKYYSVIKRKKKLFMWISQQNKL